MKDLIRLASKITNNIELFVDALQKENPGMGFSADLYESKMLWVVSWKSTKYLKEYCELEIWKDKDKYSLMSSYSTEDALKILSEDFCYYEDKTPQELFAHSDEILHQFRKGVQEASNK